MTDPTGRDLLDERMDQRLTEYGARWRDALPAPGQPEPASAHRRRWLVPVAAAAAVALVVGVTFAFTAREDPGGTAPASDPTTQPLPKCGPGDVVLGTREIEGAAGTTYLTATLQLAPTASTCKVDGGVPGVIVLDHGQVAPVEVTSDEDDTADRDLVLTDTKAVRLTLSWAVSHFCGDVDNDKILLQLGNGADVEVEGFGRTSCSPDEGAPPVRAGRLIAGGSRVSTPQNGTVTGTVTLNGGPAPGATFPLTSGEVTFTSRDGATGAGASINPDGTYRVELPPGAYDIEVTSPDLTGHPQPCHDRAGVTGGTVNEINISCPIK